MDDQARARKILELLGQIGYQKGRLDGGVDVMNGLRDGISEEGETRESLEALVKTLGQMRNVAETHLALGSALRRYVDLMEPMVHDRLKL